MLEDTITSISRSVDPDKTSYLPPVLAAELAQGVYDMKTPSRLKLFLKRPEFKQSTSNESNAPQIIQGETGAQLLTLGPMQTTSDIVLCIMGAGLYENQAFILFRGTDLCLRTGVADVLTDLRASFQPTLMAHSVHAGFLQVYETVERRVNAFVNGEAQHAECFHIIGHSLGGGLANLAAEDILRQNQYRRMRLYTFGSPRVGFLTHFATWLTQTMGRDNIFRVSNSSDPVTGLPLWPFVHTEGGYYLQHRNGLNAHFMNTYIKNIEKKRYWKNMRADVNPIKTEHQVMDWLARDTPVDATNPETWVWLARGLAWVIGKLVKKGLRMMAIAGGIAESGLFTLADYFKMYIDEAADDANVTCMYILQLFKRIAQVLHLPIPDGVKALNKAMMQSMLSRMENSMYNRAGDMIRQHNMVR